MGLGRAIRTGCPGATKTTIILWTWGEMEWVFLYMIGLKPSRNIQTSEEIKEIRHLFNLL